MGTLTDSGSPGLKHGASAWDIDGGAGVFAGATGRIVSNFLLSETGDLTDHQLGVLLLAESETSAGRHSSALEKEGRQ